MSSITKVTKRARAFVNAAPEKVGGRKPSSTRTERVQISLTVAADTLKQLDQLAITNGQTRAALINLGIVKLIRDGL